MSGEELDVGRHRTNHWTAWRAGFGRFSNVKAAFAVTSIIIASARCETPDPKPAFFMNII
ncbi:hypothetical protein MPC4_200021 [Methylocella tundrae]|uniref:Uncharacterized protein n=1 Tax=Methylocella tundrae TaxID=227605 RepID=A0A8B6M6U7_METTU|nr:hypothetical protein MPC1_400003 [Methylocella tundrae]VTZ50139.1 hypothetical protein MPC4_200021 [Methylocella tundrae]